jgi:hypothetical protein
MSEELATIDKNDFVKFITCYHQIIEEMKIENDNILHKFKTGMINDHELETYIFQRDEVINTVLFARLNVVGSIEWTEEKIDLCLKILLQINDYTKFANTFKEAKLMYGVFPFGGGNTNVRKYILVSTIDSEFELPGKGI